MVCPPRSANVDMGQGCWSAKPYGHSCTQNTSRGRQRAVAAAGAWRVFWGKEKIMQTKRIRRAAGEGLCIVHAQGPGCERMAAAADTGSLPEMADPAAKLVTLEQWKAAHRKNAATIATLLSEGPKCRDERVPAWIESVVLKLPSPQYSSAGELSRVLDGVFANPRFSFQFLTWLCGATRTSAVIHSFVDAPRTSLAYVDWVLQRCIDLNNYLWLLAAVQRHARCLLALEEKWASPYVWLPGACRQCREYRRMPWARAVYRACV